MRTAFALAAAVAAALLLVMPAAASQSVPVTIVVYNQTNEDGTAIVASWFEADGPLCSSGTVEDLSSKSSGPPSWARQNFNVVKLFVCDDGSGTFTARLSVHVIFEPEYSNATRWNIQRGTGNHAGLHGTGSLVAVWDEYDPTLFRDIYTGSVHVE